MRTAIVGNQCYFMGGTDYIMEVLPHVTLIEYSVCPSQLSCLSQGLRIRYGRRYLDCSLHVHFHWVLACNRWKEQE